MMLDDRNIFQDPAATPHPATLVLGAVEKHAGNPIIREDRDYEMRFDNMQPNVWYDPQLKKWRCWYSSFTSCAKPQKSIPFCDNEPATCGSKLPTTATAGRGSTSVATGEYAWLSAWSASARRGASSALALEMSAFLFLATWALPTNRATALNFFKLATASGLSFSLVAAPVPDFSKRPSAWNKEEKANRE